jgi:hypothetical protein
MCLVRDDAISYRSVPSPALSTMSSAAKLSTAVESFQDTSRDLRFTLNAVTSSVQDLRERVGVLEDRSGRPAYPHSMIPGDRDRKAIP